MKIIDRNRIVVEIPNNVDTDSIIPYYRHLKEKIYYFIKDNKICEKKEAFEDIDNCHYNTGNYYRYKFNAEVFLARKLVKSSMEEWITRNNVSINDKSFFTINFNTSYEDAVYALESATEDTFLTAAQKELPKIEHNQDARKFINLFNVGNSLDIIFGNNLDNIFNFNK